jgi:hypothetical protein
VKLVLTFALATALPILPDPVNAEASAPVAAARTSQKAIELLNLTSPMAELRQQLVSNFVTSFNQQLEKNPDLVALERRKPGLKIALQNAVIDELNRRVPSEIARISNVASSVYQQVLTEEDMDAAIAFFRTPAGMRMLAKMKAGAQEKIDQIRNARQLGKDINSDFDTVVAGAAASGLQGLSEADSAALVEFGQKQASIKLAAARPQIVAIMAKEVEAMSKRLADGIAPVVVTAIQRHMQAK